MSLLPERPRYSLFHNRGPSARIPSDFQSRFRSQPYRPKPYNKPIQSPPPANSAARWNHDLFEDDSNLYGPKVKFHVKAAEFITFGSPIGPIGPSPSLRPFGSTALPPPATAISPPQPPPPTKSSSNSAVPHPVKSKVARPPPAKPQSNPTNSHSGLSLLSRIQSNDSQKPFILNDAEKNSIEISSSGLRSSGQPINNSQLIKSHNQNSKNQHEFDAAMAQYLNGPVILEVANLADGTSAEDVKTAFADFGEIQECTTEEGARQSNQPTLKARMVFTNKSEAEKAVEALNGALADGLTLAVKIVGRPTRKPERSDFMTPATGIEIKSTQPAKTDTVMKSENQEDVTMEDVEPPPTPTIPTGRLRSEVVAQCDPRASIQVEPKRVPIYRAEQPKPVVRNMLARVQVFPENHLPSSTIHHYPKQRNVFGISSPHMNSAHHAQAIESSKSLLSRIKPN